MILSAQSIRTLCHADPHIKHMIEKYPDVYKWMHTDPMISPFYERSVAPCGKSFGLSSAGYDIRIDKFKIHESIVDHVRMQNGDFVLGSSLERLKIPDNIIAFVKDKSSWAREGLAVQNTVLEPGWEGYITLELSFHRPTYKININSGDPIAQVIFQRLDQATEQPYKGKYQNQINEPIESIKEQGTGTE